jgi:hypothetical protein
MPPGRIVGVAALDACVLFRGVLTDLLLCLAETECFDPIWSDQIHDEWTRNLMSRPGLLTDAIVRRRAVMDRAFPSASATVNPVRLAEVLRHCATEGERKDAHVIALALDTGADTIVTENLGDYHPVLGRLAHDLHAVTPDLFCAGLLAREPARFVTAVRLHRISMTRPAFSPDEYLTMLDGIRVGLVRTARLLAPYRDAI